MNAELIAILGVGASMAIFIVSTGGLLLKVVHREADDLKGRMTQLEDRMNQFGERLAGVETLLRSLVGQPAVETASAADRDTED